MQNSKDRRKKRRIDITTVGLAVMVCTTAIGTSTIATSSVQERTIVNDDYASLTAGVAKYLINSSNIDSIKKESSIKCIEYQKTMLSSFEESTTEVTTEAETEEPTEYYSEDELYWLSRVISAEVGNSTYESKAMCGLIVLNRVNSPSFKAETVEEVIFSPGQYETVSNGKIYNEPDDESIEIAKKILAGTIEIEIPADVVYQAEFPQGSGKSKEKANATPCFLLFKKVRKNPLLN